MARTAADDDYARALLLLISYLYNHHNSKVMVLIDEYDIPFQNALHLRDYAKTQGAKNEGGQLVEDLRKFFGVFLGSALKDNDKLEKCFMTGVVRIAGAGVFSDLNNLDVWTILDEPFSDSFGFTETDLSDLLEQVGKKEQLAEYSKWYNGYQFGRQIIYNPWSVIKALDRNKFAAYWLETSNNELIHSMLLNPKTQQEAQEINSTIAQLITKTEVKTTLQSGLIFDSRTQSLEHLWILLLSAGYLKVSHIEQIPDSDSLICTIAIPNIEIENIYKTIFRDWLQQNADVIASSPLIEHLLKGEAEQFCKELKHIFQKVLSSRDAPQSKDENESSRYEAFYHGFMVGLLALSLEKNHHKVLLKSNRESGSGYYDLVLEPKKSDDKIYNKVVIFEFKRAQDIQSLKNEAQIALKQIKDKKYPTDMEEHGIREVVCIGMAFYQRSLQDKYELYDCQQKKYLQIPTVTSSSLKMGESSSSRRLEHSFSSFKKAPAVSLPQPIQSPLSSTAVSESTSTKKPFTSTYLQKSEAPASTAKSSFSLSDSHHQQGKDSQPQSPDTLDMPPRKKTKKEDEKIKLSDTNSANSDDDFQTPPQKKDKKKMKGGK